MDYAVRKNRVSPVKTSIDSVEVFRSQLKNLTLSQIRQIAEHINLPWSDLNKFRLHFTRTMRFDRYEAVRRGYAELFTPSGKTRKPKHGVK